MAEHTVIKCVDDENQTKREGEETEVTSLVSRNPATVLAGVRPGIAVFDEETFGPVAAVIEVATEEEAMRLANQSSFGLGAVIQHCGSRELRVAFNSPKRTFLIPWGIPLDHACIAVVRTLNRFRDRSQPHGERSVGCKKFRKRQTDVPGDLPQERRSNVTALLHRRRCSAPVRVAILNMQAALTNRDEAKFLSRRHTSAGLRTGTDPIFRSQRCFERRRIRNSNAVPHPPVAW